MSDEHTSQPNRWLEDLVPHSAVRGKWIPKVGTPEKPNHLTLQLPGEQIEARICSVDQSGNACVVEIDTIPMARSHQYRKGQFVACRRTVDEILQVERWEVIPEDELKAAEVAHRLRQDEAARAWLSMAGPAAIAGSVQQVNAEQQLRHPASPATVAVGNYHVDDDVVLPE